MLNFTLLAVNSRDGWNFRPGHLFYALKEKYPEIPMILLTGHPMEEELKEMEADGLGRHLLKPPDTEELAWAVAELLGRDIG